ncbi:MAG: hypothetical protein II942_04355 [Alphaproteobacteria bacterium]|nr:hypothetical protein [Alphaproteobacteria bacterium]
MKSSGHEVCCPKGVQAANGECCPADKPAAVRDYPSLKEVCCPKGVQAANGECCPADKPKRAESFGITPTVYECCAKRGYADLDFACADKCPEGQERTYGSGYLCAPCKEPLVWDSEQQACTCPKGGTRKGGYCCKNHKAWDDDAEDYTKVDDEHCPCPENQIRNSATGECEPNPDCPEGKSATKDGVTTCCADNNEPVGNPDDQMCCPPLGEKYAITRECCEARNGTYSESEEEHCKYCEICDDESTAWNWNLFVKSAWAKTCHKYKECYDGYTENDQGECVPSEDDCPDGTTYNSEAGKCCNGAKNAEGELDADCCTAAGGTMITNPDGETTCCDDQRVDLATNKHRPDLCCANGYAHNAFYGWDDENLECCAEGEHGIYAGDGTFSTVCCPKGIDAAANGTCCKEGEETSSYYDDEDQAHYGCCASGMKYTSNGCEECADDEEVIEGRCCNIANKYSSDGKDKCCDDEGKEIVGEGENKQCCDSSQVAYEGETKVCCTDENKEIVEIDGTKQCKDKCDTGSGRNSETGECEECADDEEVVEGRCCNIANKYSSDGKDKCCDDEGKEVVVVNGVKECKEKCDTGRDENGDCIECADDEEWVDDHCCNMDLVVGEGEDKHCCDDSKKHVVTENGTKQCVCTQSGSNCESTLREWDADSCSCKCKRTEPAESCGEGKEWSVDACHCVCLMSAEEANCREEQKWNTTDCKCEDRCTAPRVWNSTTRTCKCPTDMQQPIEGCGTDKEWVYSKCSCECVSGKHLEGDECVCNNKEEKEQECIAKGEVFEPNGCSCWCGPDKDTWYNNYPSYVCLDKCYGVDRDYTTGNCKCPNGTTEITTSSGVKCCDGDKAIYEGARLGDADCCANLGKKILPEGADASALGSACCDQDVWNVDKHGSCCTGSDKLDKDGECCSELLDDNDVCCSMEHLVTYFGDTQNNYGNYSHQVCCEDKAAGADKTGHCCGEDGKVAVIIDSSSLWQSWPGTTNKRTVCCKEGEIPMPDETTCCAPGKIGFWRDSVCCAENETPVRSADNYCCLTVKRIWNAEKSKYECCGQDDQGNELYAVGDENDGQMCCRSGEVPTERYNAAGDSNGRVCCKEGLDADADGNCCGEGEKNVDGECCPSGKWSLAPGGMNVCCKGETELYYTSSGMADCCDSDKLVTNGNTKTCCNDENMEVVEVDDHKECKEKCSESQERTPGGECENKCSNDAPYYCDARDSAGNCTNSGCCENGTVTEVDYYGLTHCCTGSTHAVGDTCESICPKDGDVEIDPSYDDNGNPICCSNGKLPDENGSYRMADVDKCGCPEGVEPTEKYGKQYCCKNGFEWNSDYEGGAYNAESIYCCGGEYGYTDLSNGSYVCCDDERYHGKTWYHESAYCCSTSAAQASLLGYDDCCMAEGGYFWMDPNGTRHGTCCDSNHIGYASYPDEWMPEHCGCPSGNAPVEFQYDENSDVEYVCCTGLGTEITKDGIEVSNLDACGCGPDDDDLGREPGTHRWCCKKGFANEVYDEEGTHTECCHDGNGNWDYSKKYCCGHGWEGDPEFRNGTCCDGMINQATGEWDENCCPGEMISDSGSAICCMSDGKEYGKEGVSGACCMALGLTSTECCSAWKSYFGYGYERDEWNYMATSCCSTPSGAMSNTYTGSSDYKFCCDDSEHSVSTADYSQCCPSNGPAYSLSGGAKECCNGLHGQGSTTFIEPDCCTGLGGSMSSDYSVCCSSRSGYKIVSGTDAMNAQTERDNACGCPEGSRRSEVEGYENVCCSSSEIGKEVTEDNPSITKDNYAACGCPSNQSGWGTWNKDGKICCGNNGYAWDGSNYSAIDTKYCGCPDGYSPRGGPGSDSNICCNQYSDRISNGGSQQNDYTTCGCPYDNGDQGELKNGTCCKWGYAYDRNAGTYSEVNITACDCPQFAGNQGENKNGTCCYNNLAYDSTCTPLDVGYPYCKLDVEHCGCPTNGEKKYQQVGNVCCEIETEGDETYRTCKDYDDVWSNTCCPNGGSSPSACTKAGGTWINGVCCKQGQDVGAQEFTAQCCSLAANSASPDYNPQCCDPTILDDPLASDMLKGACCTDAGGSWDYNAHICSGV